MTQNLPLWADLLLTVWVAVVAVTFFGPIFVPAVGLWAAPAEAVYVVLVMAAAVTLGLRVVHRRVTPKTPPSGGGRVKIRKKR